MPRLDILMFPRHAPVPNPVNTATCNTITYIPQQSRWLTEACEGVAITVEKCQQNPGDGAGAWREALDSQREEGGKQGAF